MISCGRSRGIRSLKAARARAVAAGALFNRSDSVMICVMESNQKGKQAPRRRFHCRTRGPVCAPRFTSRG